MLESNVKVGAAKEFVAEKCTKRTDLSMCISQAIDSAIFMLGAPSAHKTDYYVCTSTGFQGLGYNCEQVIRFA
jgi:hypothetical protein